LKPKILIIADSTPYPARDGKRQRNLAFVNATTPFFQVDYLILGNLAEYQLAISESKSEVNFHFMDLNGQGKLFKKMGIIYSSNHRIRQKLKKFLKGKDYSAILSRHATLAKDLPVVSNLVIDEDDYFEELMSSKIRIEPSLIKKLRYLQILLANKLQYHNLLKKANQIIFAKQQNTSYSSFLLPNLPFQSIFNQRQRQFDFPQTENLLFVGKLSYLPNSAGISWFLEEVWTILKAKRPRLRLTIVSVVDPDDVLGELIQRSTDVDLQINIPYLEDVYLNHFLCIVPIFFGSGSNIKLTESLFHYRKVISTAFGARGFEDFVTDGLVTLEENPRDWVKSINSILNTDYAALNFVSLDSYFSFEEWQRRFLEIIKNIPSN
jgi:hypothetical protein